MVKILIYYILKRFKELSECIYCCKILTPNFLFFEAQISENFSISIIIFDLSNETKIFLLNKSVIFNLVGYMAIIYDTKKV